MNNKYCKIIVNNETEFNALMQRLEELGDSCWELFDKPTNANYCQFGIPDGKQIIISISYCDIRKLGIITLRHRDAICYDTVNVETFLKQHPVISVTTIVAEMIMNCKEIINNQKNANNDSRSLSESDITSLDYALIQMNLMRIALDRIYHGIGDPVKLSGTALKYNG